MKFARRWWMYLSVAVMTAALVSRYVVSFAIGRWGNIPGVRIIVVRDREVLLVSHWYAPGVWTLPGGGVERGETISEAAIREVREETGLEVKSIAGTVGTYNSRLGKGATATVVYTGDFEGSLSLKPNLEIMSRSWFSIDNLPDEISPANRRRIEAYRDGVRDEKGGW